MLSKSEWGNLKALWRKRTLASKILVIVLGFLLVSPIASLSDRIFEWRGFFADGHRFYMNSLADPAIKLFESHGWHYDLQELNVLLVQAFFSFNIFRFFGRILTSAPANGFGAKGVGMSLVAAVLLPLILVFDYANPEGELTVGEYQILAGLGLYFFYGLLLSIEFVDKTPRISNSEFDAMTDEQQIQHLEEVLNPKNQYTALRYDVLTSYFAPPLIALAVVLLLGAVNSALMR